MDLDVIDRARARLSSLVEHVQEEELRPILPCEFVRELNSILTGPCSGQLAGFREFEILEEQHDEEGIDRTLFLAKADGALSYLNDATRNHRSEASIGDRPYRLSELASESAEALPLPISPSLFSRWGGWIRSVFSSGPSREEMTTRASWRKIAREVLERKRLLMTATDDLRSRHISNAFTLATVDVFVEKAQKQLTDRARNYRIWGVATGLAALAVVTASIWVIRSSSVVKDLAELGNLRSPELEVGGIILTILRASSIAGLFVGAIIFLIFVSRALLHEMVVLYQRRHALRFGRLFIYLHPHKISVSDLQTAFNWNGEYRSAFKDIRPEKIMQSVPGRVAEASVELGQKAIDVVKQAQQRVQDSHA